MSAATKPAQDRATPSAISKRDNLGNLFFAIALEFAFCCNIFWFLVQVLDMICDCIRILTSDR